MSVEKGLEGRYAVQSKAQARYMFAKHPKMAKEWASKTRA